MLIPRPIDLSANSIGFQVGMACLAPMGKLLSHSPLRSGRPAAPNTCLGCILWDYNEFLCVHRPLQ